jgi:hypothetical protein
MTSRCQVGAFLSLDSVLSREHLLHDGKARQGVGPATATVDHADIRGLATTLLVSVGRLPRSMCEGRCMEEPPHNVFEGYAKPGPHPLPCLILHSGD